MANDETILPMTALQTAENNPLTAAIREAAQRKERAETLRKEQERAQLMQLATKAAPALAAAFGGPGAAAATGAVVPLLAELYASYKDGR